MTDHIIADTGGDGPPTHELLQPTQLNDGLLRPFLEFLGHYSAEVERRAGEGLSEHTRECESVMTTLRNERDTARENLLEEHAKAETNAENLDAQIRGLRESLSALEISLDEKTTSIHNLSSELDERGNQLSDAEVRYSMMERTLLHSLIRAENENNGLREQLTEMRHQIDTANSSATEERLRNENYRAELTTVMDEVKELKRQRIATEDQLKTGIDELTVINNRLQGELLQARTDAERLDVTRQEREELHARCQELTESVSNLTDERLFQQNTIDSLEGQRDAMNCEVHRLESGLHDEQVQSTELRFIISNQLQEVDELKSQRDGLQSTMNELTNTNAELQASYDKLNAEITELKPTTNEVVRVKAKIPRFPAIVKYKGSPPKKAFVQQGVVALYNQPRN
ncbi:hypothetical protein BJY01DRAFT_250378 [Aspergillus pseudoustus]|uniref:Uncharacterized protein n=1 Tax=Aspergillus pseudoustus TaxID=1810923 RepID=A0ABR4JHX3_9EURO